MTMWPKDKRADLERQFRELTVLRLTDREIADRLNVSQSWLQRTRARLHMQRIPQSERVSREKNPAWTGGARVLLKGYWYCYAPDHPNRTKQNRMAEHRLVMETKLGRLLDPKEVVHHLDGNPRNNHPANLEVFATNTDHLRHELKGRCPKWTPEGWARMQAGVQLSARNRRAKANERRRLQSIAHSADTGDSTGGSPVSEMAAEPQK